MDQSIDQREYWDKVAHKKTFNHQINWSVFKKYLDESSNVLDFGCGYGRLTNELNKQGYNAIGADSSLEMIKRAKNTFTNFSFLHLNDNRFTFQNNSFDAVLLFTVLTCIPSSSAQKTIVSSLKKILKPDGILYISDLLINVDNRNIKRYNDAPNNKPYGVFKLKEGAVFRHHSLEYLSNDLLKEFNINYSKLFEVETMNGNKSNAIQIIAKKE